MPTTQPIEHDRATMRHLQVAFYCAFCHRRTTCNVEAPEHCPQGFDQLPPTFEERPH